MRKLAWFSGGFGLACLLGCFWIVPPLWGAVGAALLLGIALLVWNRARLRPHERGLFLALPRESRPRRRCYESARRLTALLTGAVLAFVWTAGYTALVRAPAERVAGTERSVTGTVISLPAATSVGGWAVTLRLSEPVSADVLLYGGADWGDLALGDTVACTARLEKSDLIYGDETTYYSARGVYLLGYCDEAPSVTRAERLPWYLWPTKAADRLKEGIRRALDGVAAPLGVAVTTGDRAGLTDIFRSALSRTGTAHAVAVSGMHVSYLVAFALLLTRGRRRWAVAVVPVLVFYALMVGATPSALRAVVMQGAVLAAPIVGREKDSPTALGGALLLLLLQNPFAAASVSLQLSFAAVAGILLVSEPMIEGLTAPLERRLGEGKRLGERALLALGRLGAASVSVTLGATVFTQPVNWLYFREISLLSPLANLLALWAVSALFLGALLVGGLTALWPPAAALGVLVDPFGHYIHGLIQWMGGWRFAALDGHNIYYALWLGAVYLVAGGLAVGRKSPRRYPLILGCLGLLLGAAVGLNVLAMGWGALTVTALDVGQGAATALVSKGRTALVDCGGSGTDNAGDVAARYFASFGERRLDLLVLTHFDADHCSGVEELFARMEVAAVAVPRVEAARERMDEILALAEAEGARIISVTELRTIPLGEAVLTLYPPLGAGTSNEEGLFFTASAGDFDVLITGDADSFVENMLVTYYNIPDVELLVVGHHGAADSTGDDLLAAVRPELAVVSVGDNHYGHPSDRVLERLAEAGCRIYRTDTMGSVSFSIRGDGYAARTQR